jgi:hypothetical protein
VIRALPSQAVFNASNNIVVDLTKVPMPCNGTWQRQAYSFDKCGSPEIFGWHAWLENYTTTVR